jgi:CDP-6-deoxy-D-xylo-4-hexulose-3-dehydrase
MKALSFENFTYLKNKLSSLTQFIDLPQVTENSEPSWFGFPITLKTVKLAKYGHSKESHKTGGHLIQVKLI